MANIEIPERLAISLMSVPVLIQLVGEIYDNVHDSYPDEAKTLIANNSTPTGEDQALRLVDLAALTDLVGRGMSELQEIVNQSKLDRSPDEWISILYDEAVARGGANLERLVDRHNLTGKWGNDDYPDYPDDPKV